MAGPLDLKGTVSIKDNAKGPLKAIAGSMRDIAKQSGSIRPPSLAGSISEIQRLQQAYRNLGETQRTSTKAAQVLHDRRMQQMREEQAQLRRMKIAGDFAAGAGYGYAARSFLSGPIGAVSKDGKDMYRLRQNMTFAGASADEVKGAEKAAWSMSNKYRNMPAVDVMALINDARGIYGTQSQANEHIEPIARVGSFLKAYTGAESGSTVEMLRELNAAMKTGEISGKFTPAALEKHMEQIAAMKVVYGDQVKIQDYLTAQRTAGASFLASSDKWRYGYFPALVQEYGSGAGTMMATSAQKVLADTGNKKYAVEAQKRYGLRDREGQWVNQRLFGENPLDWIATEMMPRLEKTGALQRDGEGHVTNSPDLIKAVGQMFPDRNAAKEMVELIVQFSKLQKNAALMEKVHSDYQGYNENSMDYQGQAVAAQATNLATILGDTLVPAARGAAQALQKIMALMVDYPAVGLGLGAAGTAAGTLGLLKFVSRHPRLAGPLGGLVGFGLGGDIAAGLGGGLLAKGLLGGKAPGLSRWFGMKGAQALGGATAAEVAAGAGGGGILARLGLGGLAKAGGRFGARVIPGLGEVVIIGGAAYGGYEAWKHGGDIMGGVAGGALGLDPGGASVPRSAWAPRGQSIPVTSAGAAAASGSGGGIAQAEEAVSAAQSAAEQVRAVFNIDLSEAGRSMMESLAQGITEGGSAAIAAAQNVAAGVRAAGSRVPLNTGPNMQGAD